VLQGAHFKEFIVNFDGLHTDVARVNKALYRNHGIVGGKNLAAEYPQFGQSALFCVTEAHTLEDINRLVAALGSIAEGGGARV
jgi:glycine dehydrogenase subunit 1